MPSFALIYCHTEKNFVHLNFAGINKDGNCATLNLKEFYKQDLPGDGMK